MPLCEHIGGSVFRYLDRDAYCAHMSRASPSSFFVPSRSTPRLNLESDFDALGDRLFNRTNEVVMTGGLFHIKAYARQMIQIDEELSRRFGDDWRGGDMVEIRQTLARLAAIQIMPPSMPRPRRRPTPTPTPSGQPRFQPPPVGVPPRQVDPEVALREPVHTATPHRPPSHSGNPSSPFGWFHHDTTSDTNFIPGMNAVDGRMTVGGIPLPRWVCGEAGNLPAMQREYIADGESDAQTDFRSGDREGAHQRRRSSSRYLGNSDYRNGYDRRWGQLERQ